MGLAQDRVVVVTGASRGAGKGIACALGATGATVYVTGRTQRDGDAALPGGIETTAEAVTAAGGLGIPVGCDHGQDTQVAALFERVAAERGRVDILVNNATALPASITQTGPFWEKPLDQTCLFDVGLRSHYVASWYAAPLLLAAGAGLVVNTSSFGGRVYMHGPAYGAGKAAVDKMAHDMAHDFRPHGVAVVALWMGLLLTERTRAVFDAQPELYSELRETAETPEFTGRVIDALARDPALMEKSGQVLVGAELAEHYGVTEADGRRPASHRSFFGEPTTYGEAVVE